MAPKKESYLSSINCRNNSTSVHNARCRYTHGYICEDCGSFINKDTLEYFMTEGCSDIWMALHNRNTKTEISNELKDLMYKLQSFDNNYLSTLTKREAEKFKNETYKILLRYNILDTEATVTL